jgi:hypothetical protein
VNARHIVRRTLKTRKAGKTDWKRVDALTDEEIQRAVREDPDAAPIVDKARPGSRWRRSSCAFWPVRNPRKKNRQSVSLGKKSSLAVLAADDAGPAGALLI